MKLLIKLSCAFALVILAGCRSVNEAYVSDVKVQTLVKTSVDVAGQKLQYPAGGTAELTEVLVELAPGQSTGWHTHPNPCAAYILQGEITVEDELGVKRHFAAGDAFAEVVKRRHCGVNEGRVPVKILLFAAGEAGVPVSQK